MERAGFPTQQIEETLVKLRGWRYLDDRAFARGFALSVVEHKRWGPSRVRGALRQRGVSEEHIEEALSEAFPEGETATLERALERFRRSDRRRGTTEQEKARAFRHLRGRGFSSAAIWEALGKDEETEI
jgi:regulatory protein